MRLIDFKPQITIFVSLLLESLLYMAQSPIKQLEIMRQVDGRSSIHQHFNKMLEYYGFFKIFLIGFWYNILTSLCDHIGALLKPRFDKLVNKDFNKWYPILKILYPLLWYIPQIIISIFLPLNKKYYKIFGDQISSYTGNENGIIYTSLIFFYINTIIQVISKFLIHLFVSNIKRQGIYLLIMDNILILLYYPLLVIRNQNIITGKYVFTVGKKLYKTEGLYGLYKGFPLYILFTLVQYSWYYLIKGNVPYFNVGTDLQNKIISLIVG